ncbi:hypothetical protein KAU32_11360 [bacterium]|nr:hypothetical protein [bacterium]
MKTKKRQFLILGIIALFILLIGGCLTKQDKVLFTPNDLIITADSVRFFQGDTVQLTVTGGLGPFTWTFEGDTYGCTIDHEGVLKSRQIPQNTYTLAVKATNIDNAWGEFKMLFEKIIILGPGIVSQSANVDEYQYDAENTQGAVAWAVVPDTYAVLSQDGSATAFVQPEFDPNGDQNNCWAWLVCQDTEGNTAVKLLQCVHPYLQATTYSVDCDSSDTITVTAYYMHGNAVDTWKFDGTYLDMTITGANTAVFTPKGVHGLTTISAVDDLGNESRERTITLYKTISIIPTTNYDGSVGFNFNFIAPLFSVVTTDTLMAIGGYGGVFIYRSYFGFHIPNTVTSDVIWVELSLTAESYYGDMYANSDLIIDSLGVGALDSPVPGIEEGDFASQNIGGTDPYTYPEFTDFGIPYVINHKHWARLKTAVISSIGNRADFGIKCGTEGFDYGVVIYASEATTAEYMPTLTILYY